MAKKAYDYIVLRTDTVEAGGLTFSRDLYAEPNGMLEQHISVQREDNPPMVNIEHHFPVKESADNAIDVLDKHWKNLSAEITEIEEQARYYFYAKTNKLDDELEESFISKTLMTLSGRLLDQSMLDEPVEKGFLDDENTYPNAHISNRLDAMRQAAWDYDIPFDRFENLIDELATNSYAAYDTYEDVMNGNFDGDDSEEMGGSSDEFSSADHDGGVIDAPSADDQDWSILPDDEYNPEEWEEVPEDELDTPDIGDGDNGSILVRGQKEPLEPWLDEDYDPDDERDEQVTYLLDDFIDYVVDFTNVANDIWKDSVQQIKDGVAVSYDQSRVESLRDIMNDASIAYEKFKDAALELGTSNYELHPVFEAYEDPQTGTFAQMQKACSMAKRPKELQKMITKVLPQEREM